MAVGGLLLRLNTTLIRILEFLAAAVCLVIFAYFLADLADHSLHIPAYAEAIVGIAGAAVIYTAFAVILTCFLGGVAFFAFLAILLDLCFMGAFVAVAVLTRHSDKCSGGTVTSVMGTGAPGTPMVGVGNLKRACELEEAVFGAAIAAAVLFLISLVLQLLLAMHHKKEKRYGPGPSNNYGKDKRRPWVRKPRVTNDAELGAVGATGLVAEKHVHDRNYGARDNTIRPSAETGMTGSTMAGGEAYGGPMNKYGNDRPVHNHGALGMHEPAHGPEITHVAEPTAPVHGRGYPHVEPGTGTGAAELGGNTNAYAAGTNY